MQVQVIENRADISGKIREVAPHKTLENYYTVTIDVDTVTPIEGMANLMASAKGMSIDISVPAEQAKKLEAGVKATLRVKKTGPTDVMAVPPPSDKP